MDTLYDNRYRNIDQTIQTRIEMVLLPLTHLLGQYGIALNTLSVGFAIDPMELRTYPPPSRLRQDIPVKIQNGRHETCRLVEPFEQRIHPLEIEILQTVVFHSLMPHKLIVHLPSTKSTYSQWHSLVFCASKKLFPPLEWI